MSLSSSTDDFRPAETLDAVTEHSEREPVILYKHSAYCGVSLRARRELERLAETEAPPIYEVVVQQARALSNEIAERLGIRHESPQVIVLHAGQAVFHASHRRVTADAVRSILKDLNA